MVFHIIVSNEVIDVILEIFARKLKPRYFLFYQFD